MSSGEKESTQPPQERPRRGRRLRTSIPAPGRAAGLSRQQSCRCTEPAGGGSQAPGPVSPSVRVQGGSSLVRGAQPPQRAGGAVLVSLHICARLGGGDSDGTAGTRTAGRGDLTCLSHPGSGRSRERPRGRVPPPSLEIEEGHGHGPPHSRPETSHSSGFQKSLEREQNPSFSF